MIKRNAYPSSSMGEGLLLVTSSSSKCWGLIQAVGRQGQGQMQQWTGIGEEEGVINMGRGVRQKA
jgi:hypothetical protein